MSRDPSSTARITVDALPETGDASESAAEVRDGLRRTPKDISATPRYFYDDRGSELFERITEQPEYYQTRTEYSLLLERADEVVSRVSPGALVELGSGAASKTRALLDAMHRAGEPMRYLPLDVSDDALRSSSERLAGEYPELEVQGFVGDFNGSLREVLGGEDRKLVAFLGGTIGNFTPEYRTNFLRKLGETLKPGDHLLVGMDLLKDPAVIEAAYDDAAGVTAEFNLNLLNNMNRELAADFEPDRFRHRALFNPEASRLEMWLESDEEQEVRLEELQMTVTFGEGEGMRTEISTKFTRRTAAEVFSAAGFELSGFYTDEEALFSLALCEVG